METSLSPGSLSLNNLFGKKYFGRHSHGGKILRHDTICSIIVFEIEREA